MDFHGHDHDAHYVEPPSTTGVEFELTEEQRLLKEALERLAKEEFYPLGNGFSTTITGPDRYEPSWSEIMQTNQAYWDKIGVKVQLNIIEYGRYQQTTVRGEYEGMAGPSPKSGDDPDFWLTTMFTKAGGRNISHVNDPTLESMIQKQVAITDEAARKKAMLEIFRYTADQVYYISNPGDPSHFVRQPWVKNYQQKFVGDWWRNLGPSLEVAWIEK